VHLEFIPFTGIRDLAAAWEIVRGADRPNGGLVMDAWHYFLGRPDDALLRTVPAEKVVVVQLADAPAERRGTLADELYHRLAPVEGVLPLAELVRTLDETGVLASVAPEIFSDRFNALVPEDAGRQAAASVQQLLEQALADRPH
jgi:sugar phosphate isomerase/epimerase